MTAPHAHSSRRTRARKLGYEFRRRRLGHLKASYLTPLRSKGIFTQAPPDAASSLRQRLHAAGARAQLGDDIANSEVLKETERTPPH